jgi:hypothetical protein
MFGSKVHYITTNIESAKALRSKGLIPVVDGIIPGTSGMFYLLSFLFNIMIIY